MPFDPQSGGAHDEFRKNTEKHKVLAGVTGLSFLCKTCKQPRQTPGRKQAVRGDKRSGWVCAHCLKEKNK